MFFTKPLLLAAALITVTASSAFADIFYWQDKESKLTLTFPDRWRVVHGQQPDEVLTIMAPGVNDHAGCRMRIRDDKRFTVYPRHLEPQVQRVNFSRKFWEDYVGEFDEAQLIETHDDAGLSYGHAGYAQASFISTAGPRVEKRALMLASVYNGKRYVFECSAEKEAYAKWYRPFLSILKSVQFRQENHRYMDGDYRNFMADAPLYVHGATRADLYEY